MKSVKIIAPLVLLVILIAGVKVYTGMQQAGVSLNPVAPESLIPATADVYVGLNRGGDQAAALSSLWTAYQAHPGTGASVVDLGKTFAQSGLDVSQIISLTHELGDQGALAGWTKSLTDTGHAAFIVQTRASDLLTGKNPLNGIATTDPITAYQNTQLYTVHLKGVQTPAYACLLSGDGVLATDLPTLEQVIDTAQGRQNALTADKTFAGAVAALPASRVLTAYVAPAFLRTLLGAASGASALAPLGLGSMPFSSGMGTAVQREKQKMGPLAVAVVASTDGLTIQTTGQPLPVALHTTPNAAAGVMGHNALLYLSAANLGGLLGSALRALPAGTLSRFQAQLGIDVQSDLLSWMHGEVALSVNDGAAPLLGQLVSLGLAGAHNGSAGASASPASHTPTLPGGSLELAFKVDDPAQTQAHLMHVFTRAAQAIGPSGRLAMPTTRTLPDGTTAYVFSSAPGVGYMFKDGWLIVSTNLSADASGIDTPLSKDAAYMGSLAHLPTGPYTGVEYMNLTRTTALVDQWLAFGKALSPQAFSGLSSGAGGWTWPRAEALIAPIQSITTATMTDHGTSERSAAFIAIH